MDTLRHAPTNLAQWRAASRPSRRVLYRILEPVETVGDPQETILRSRIASSNT